jgi:histidinol-phosphate aminotransferase
MTNNNTIQQYVRKNILQLAPYASARHEFEGEADIFLDANENPFDTGLNRYPDPLQHELKQRLSAVKNVPVEHIFLGNGSDEAIDLLIRIFCEPRIDHIITLPPTYGMYQVSAGIADVEVKTISLTPDFQPNVEAILKASNKHSKILFLCSPNNPSGNDIEPVLIHQLLQQFQGIVVIDEAYNDFSRHPSFSQQLAQYPNLVVLQTFSKAWGIAAVRLGMAYASKEIIALFNKVKAPYNLNILTQRMALEVLEKYEQVEQWVKEILEEKTRLETQLTVLPFVQQVFASSANFLLVKVDDPDHLYRYLVEQKIIVRNRSKVPLCEGCLRITVGTPLENNRLIATLEKYQ